MFCRFCGTELRDDAIFCKKCGKKLQQDEDIALEESCGEDAVEEKAPEDLSMQYAKQGVKSNIYEKLSDGLMNKITSTNTQRVNAQQFAIIFKSHILDNCDSDQLRIIKKTTKMINMGWRIEVGDYLYYASKSDYWIKCFSTKEIWQLKQDFFGAEMANFKKIAKQMIEEKESA